MTQKIITVQEFDDAVGIISAYRNQLVINQTTNTIPEGRKINIKDAITNTMYNALVIYYRAVYKVDLKKSDLSCMDVNLLASIDYGKFMYYRGLGAVRIMKFKKIMEEYTVIK